VRQDLTGQSKTKAALAAKASVGGQWCITGWARGHDTLQVG
jgi:hypothetical protein